MMSDGWNVEVTRMVVNYVIVVVSDMRRSVAFYRDTIGLPMKFESPGWTEFATDGATIALHPGEISGGKATRPSGDQPGQCRPGLGVPDLDLFHRKMVEQSVPCIQEPTNVFGARVAQYADPDGLAISVGEEKRGR